MNEFDIFIKNIILQCIEDKGSCSYIEEQDRHLVFNINFENQHHVVSRQQFKIFYPVRYSIESSIKYQVEILRYLDSKDEQPTFISNIVEVLKSEIESFLHSTKPKGKYFIC